MVLDETYNRIWLPVYVEIIWSCEYGYVEGLGNEIGML